MEHENDFFYHHEFNAPIATLEGALNITELLIENIEIEMNNSKELNNLTTTQKVRIQKIEGELKELKFWKNICVNQLNLVREVAKNKLGLMI